MWDEQLRWFGERHRAIAPDLKGFGGTPDAATPGGGHRQREQQQWIRLEGDLQLLINRLVDQLVGRDTSRRAETVRLARQLMGTNPPAGSAGWRR